MISGVNSIFSNAGCAGFSLSGSHILRVLPFFFFLLLFLLPFPLPLHPSSSSLPSSSSPTLNPPQYDEVGKLLCDFDPYKNLWVTVADWLKWHETWMNDSLINIDPELLATNVSNAFKAMRKSAKHSGK